MNRSSLFPKPVNSRITASGTVDRRGTALARMVSGERVVISRRHCHFESIAAPSGRRDMRALQAARLAAKARSPFKSPAIRIVWCGDRVGIWSWPSDILAPLEGAEFEAVPESVLDEPAEGEVLRRREGGYEGQVWRAGHLVASRWWDREPSEDQWARFVRAVPGQAGDAPVIESEDGTADVQGALTRLSEAASRARPRDYAALAVLLVLVPFLYFAGQWVRASQQAGALERELETLANSTSDVVAARAEALGIRADLQTYAGLLESPHPASGLAVFAEAASGFDATLQSFTVQDGSIEIELSGQRDVPLADLVEQLEASPVLSEVRLEAGSRINFWHIFATYEAGEAG